MKSIFKILLTALAVVILAKFLPGIMIDGYMYAILVAILLSILRFTVKPILVLLTFPVTLITFGLFIFIINAVLILIVDFFVSGFSVSSIWAALLFSVLLSVFQSVLFTLVKEDKNN